MIALDSSVIVAAFRSVDARHEAAAKAIHRATTSNEGIVVPLHALVETYAVLTRMPIPYRMSPPDALSLLRDTFGTSRLAPMNVRSLWPLLGGLADADLGGGLTYDAVILRCCEDAGATALLTLNPRDFLRLSPSIEIRTP